MAIIKCKMCGGDIAFTPGATYGTCEYCGSTSTIPKAEDEQKLNRYNRANHFRRQCEFDKAIAAYEKILEQDDTDAEARWGTVLSRYGIEYVEDPVTKKRIPTCHRVQVASILADADYLAAVENAPDAESRRLYEEQAAQIAEIQKGILAISASEKPYDVFICYKETDESGQRTRDSQWAQDVYYGLTDVGYKVFFSRITLEDKLGQQYEPYIFAALNSAKVMVVIGSKPEYFNAVWVKNEWSRFLALMVSDRKRLLIPCYRGMDPYDLPEELSTLQSQDMSKIGFMQDLLRGVKKVLEADKTAEAPAVVQQVVQTSGEVAAPGVSSLMERARLFMEDGDFASASEYLNRVLDIDPKYAPAYAAKACVAFRMSKESDLADATFLYEDNADWQKALRFADSAQKAAYEGYITKVHDRVNAQIRTYAYDCAVEMALGKQTDRSSLDRQLEQYRQNCLYSAQRRIGDNRRRADAAANEVSFQQAVAANEPGDMLEAHLRSAAEMFSAIQDAEAAERAQQCLALAEQARQKAIYEAAKDDYRRHRRDPINLDRIAQDFLSIPEYKDAQAMAQECLEEAEATRSKLYRDVLSAMEKAGSSSDAWQSIYSDLSHSALKNYRDVAALREKAEARRAECRAAEQEQARRQAAAAAAKKKLQTIIGILAVAAVVAIVLVVTKVIIPKSRYNSALDLRANGQWEEAAAVFAQLGEYSDAATQITETRYLHALACMNTGNYQQAYQQFVQSKGYKDVDTLLASDKNLAAAARDAMFSVGNYVTFGTYPQTKAGNDATPIEWLVLDRDGDHVLLLSRYGLDAQPYHTSYTSITWENCTLRTWLNKDFINRAFTEAEQAAILLTNVDNSSSQCYSRWSTNGGNNTQDKVFLLSCAEANKYLNVTRGSRNNIKSRVAPTAYIESAKTLLVTRNGDCFWWLRSPGDSQKYVSTVAGLGFLEDEAATALFICVRPALWVDIGFDVF